MTLIIGLTILAFLFGGWALGKWFDWLEPRVLWGFTRWWHHCTTNSKRPVPLAGPLIVVANHPSVADPAFLVATTGRPLVFLHARESFDTFVITRLFRRAGSIPVSRDGHDAPAVRTALRRLAEGKAIAIFPEGEVSRVARVRGLQLKRGAALLALRSRAPVVPVHIAGSREDPNVVRAWLWPSPDVRVTYGPPIDLSDYYDRPITRELLGEVTEILMERVTMLGPLDGARSIPATQWQLGPR